MKKQINNLIIKNKNISTQHHHETKTLVKNKNKKHVKNKVLALCNEGDIFLDSGCTDTSYRETEAISVKYDNTQIAPTISLKTAGGQKIKSIKSGKIKFDNIDHEINVFKNEDLSLSLHSAADFTNNGDNKVILHKRGFEIVNPDDKVILKGNKLPDDRLWKLPPTREAIGNLFIKNEFDAEFVAYSSACFGNPPDSTLIKAVKRGYLSNYKRLTPKMIHANQPHSIASAEGHLDRVRKGLRSTKPNLEETITENDYNDNEIFVKTVNVDETFEDMYKTHALNCDATGRFPYKSDKGNEYILVAVYKNYIHVEPLPSRSADSYVKAYAKVIDFFRKRNNNFISVVRLDNETSAKLEKLFREEDLVFEYVAPTNKRSNKAERAIRSFKNHFIATLATVDNDFPMRLWDEILEQAEITLAMLRPFADDDKISSYEGIFKKKYDFEAHPIAPIGLKIVSYEPSDKRGTWDKHGLEGYYLGPALQHYRSIRAFVNKTNAIRVTDQVDYFPDKFKLPGASKEEILHKAITNLETKINSQNREIDISEAIKILNEIKSNSIPSFKPALDITHTYRSLGPKERSDPYISNLLLTRIGQHFVDTDTKEEFIIDNIQTCKLEGDNGPNIMVYKLFPDNQYITPSHTRDYVYARVDEIESANYINWILRGESKLAAAILSNSPRDFNRSINHSLNGKPLKFGSAIKSSDRDLWIKCDEEEWERLFNECVFTPIFYNEIPKTERKNIAYYNRQIKEKIKKINGTEYIEARVRGTFGGDAANFEGAKSSNTAEYPVVKLLFNSVLSKHHKNKTTKFITMDMIDFYLKCPMEIDAYMCINEDQIPTGIIEKYNLKKFIENGKLRLKLLKAMYGHPVAGKLSNALLKKTIESDGYYEDDLVPCLFHHKERDTKFTLIVDDIGAEVNSEDDITHLANSIGKIWKVKIDKTGSKFIGMNLNWEYDHLPLPRMTADNPTAIPDALKRFKPGITLTGKNTPAIYNSKLYKPKNSKSKILNENNNLNLPTPVPDMKEYIQQLTGTFSHYARTIDYTMIPAVNTLSRSQAKPTTQTLLEADQLLEYASRHPNNKLIFEASDMQLKCQYDASLHTLIDGRSVIGDIKYLGNYNDPPEKVQNVFDASSTVLNAVAAHIVEAEYGSAFHCGQQAYFYGIVLEALGFTQRYIEFYGDNNIAVGISNDSVKVKRAKAIEKSYHWFRDKCRRKEFKSMHIKGLYNTSDFMTKPLPKARHNLLAPNLVSVTNMKGN